MTSQKPSSRDSASYNGAATDKYSWSQTMNDVDVQIPVPKEVKKGKDVQVVIGTDSLEVRLTSEKGFLVSGKFTYPVNKHESTWSVVPGEYITVWLQKAKDRWWTALLDGEEPIDPKSIEAVMSMQDLPDEEQAKVEELMYNQEQKEKGLPTSDERKLEDVLKRAWDVEGSPFKGKPFDPSLVKLGPDDLSKIVQPPSD